MSLSPQILGHCSKKDYADFSFILLRLKLKAGTMTSKQHKEEKIQANEKLSKDFLEKVEKCRTVQVLRGLLIRLAINKNIISRIDVDEMVNDVAFDLIKYAHKKEINLSQPCKEFIEALAYYTEKRLINWCIGKKLMAKGGDVCQNCVYFEGKKIKVCKSKNCIVSTIEYGDSGELKKVGDEIINNPIYNKTVEKSQKCTTFQFINKKIKKVEIDSYYEADRLYGALSRNMFLQSDNKMALSAIWKYIRNEFSDDERRLLKLRFIEGLVLKKVSEKMNISTGKVHNLQKKLLAIIKEWASDEK